MAIYTGYSRASLTNNVRNLAFKQNRLQVPDCQKLGSDLFKGPWEEDKCRCVIRGRLLDGLGAYALVSAGRDV